MHNKLTKQFYRKLFFFTVCFTIIIFQGLRSFSVGTDLRAYLPSYLNIGHLPFNTFSYQNFEPGFIFLNKILYTLGFSKRGFLFIVACMVQIPIFYTMYKYSSLPLLSILCYFAIGNFLMTFSGLRQSIAMAICFAAYGSIKTKNLKQFICMIVIASLFHKSALFCLSLYPLYYVNIGKKWRYACYFLIIIVFIFRKKIFSILGILYYGDALEITNTGAFEMFFAYIFLYACSFIPKSTSTDYKGLRNILLLLTIIFSFSSIHPYIARIGYPLTLYMTIFIPEVVNRIKFTPVWFYHGICYTVLTVYFLLRLGYLNTLPFTFL